MSVRYDSLPTTYVSVCVSRTPDAPASTTVTMRNGSASVPLPVGPVWLTGVYVVRGLAAEPNGMASGPYNVPLTTTSVAHAVEPKNSGDVSPVWRTSQFKSSEIVIDGNGPADVIVADVAICAPTVGTNTATDDATTVIESATAATTRPRARETTRMRTPDVRPAPARAGATYAARARRSSHCAEFLVAFPALSTQAGTKHTRNRDIAFPQGCPLVIHKAGVVRCSGVDDARLARGRGTSP